MKLFLFSIKGIPRMEDYADRNLICSISELTEDENSLTVRLPWEDVEGLDKLNPKTNYAIMYDYDNGQPHQFKYFYASSYEIDFKQPELCLTLNIQRIE